MSRRIVTGIVLAIWLSGCARNSGLRCEDQGRYSAAGEVAPLRIPDDLDPPDQTEALRIPGTPDTAVAQEAGNAADVDDSADAASCTELPPEFFDAGLPG